MPTKPLLPPSVPTDPNLFALKWDQVFEVLMAIILFSLIIERFLALFFESNWYLDFEKKRKDEQKKGDFKAPIAFAFAVAFCIWWGFDAPSVILSREAVTLFGCVLTGGVIAGGSKGSVKLFHDVLGIYSSSYGRAKGLPVAGKIETETSKLEVTRTEIRPIDPNAGPPTETTKIESTTVEPKEKQ